MNSYFTLELDTAGPEIEVYTPTYTLSDIETEIRIQSNEELAQYQEVYLIDCNKERHDYIFEHKGNYLISKIIFNDIPLGIVTLYARTKDDVDNYSNTASKSFLIQKFPEIKMEISDREFNNYSNSNIKHLALKHNIRKNYLSEKIRNFKDLIHIRKIELTEEEMNNGG